MSQDARERIGFALLLLSTFAMRAIRPDQPIVENYVGRQVPTAMVARNLDRGSGFLRPQLDTGPLPNLFLVEPPIYAACVVGFRRLTGLALEPAGRLVSALAITLGAWGLHGLVRRREGPVAAGLAVGVFALLPVTIRYGRAFQPDALMLGSLLAGLRLWDEHESRGGVVRLVLGWSLLATGLAVKVIGAYVLIPLVLAIQAPRRAWKVGLALATLLPAAAWYLHAARLLSGVEGSRASADNAAIWAGALLPRAWLVSGTYLMIARFLVVRAFTPIGFAGAVWGLFVRPGSDRLWRAWFASAAGALALLVGKIHHEYYWLALAPPVAVGLARAIDGIRPRSVGVVAFVAFAGLAVAQSASTWRTPDEWRPLAAAVPVIRRAVPPESLLVAPEAVLYAADRRGCRLEVGASAARAAGEWGGQIDPAEPLALVEFYRKQGAAYVADVFDPADDPRPTLHAAIRRRYDILIERPGFLLAALVARDEDAPHVDR